MILAALPIPARCIIIKHLATEQTCFVSVGATNIDHRDAGLAVKYDAQLSVQCRMRKPISIPPLVRGRNVYKMRIVAASSLRCKPKLSIAMCCVSTATGSIASPAT